MLTSPGPVSDAHRPWAVCDRSLAGFYVNHYVLLLVPFPAVFMVLRNNLYQQVCMCDV